MEYGNWTDEDWSTLIYSIKHKECILMLGPDASVEEVDGRACPLTEILAKELAQDIAPEDQKHLNSSDLAQVSQYYLMIKRQKRKLRNKVTSFYEGKRHLRSRLHQNLAALPFYFTITSTLDSMFCNALKEEKKEPIVEGYNFRGQNPEIVQMGKVETPLLFYLYGTIDDPKSLVLTENDLIDFLMAVTKKDPPLPNNILSELRDTNKSLLFLGFGFKHWYLRILLHVLWEDKKNRECCSFALEQFTPRNMDEFQRTIFFFGKGEFNIQICNKELQSFVKELRKRYEASRTGSERLLPSKPLTDQTQDKPTVFICHANKNKEDASRLYTQLENAGFEPWLDEKNLQVGDEWDPRIEEAIEKIDYFVVLQSKALEKRFRGYVNKEINLALEQRKNFAPGINFITPVTIDGTILERLNHLNTIDISNEEGIEKLIKKIRSDQERRNKK